MLKAKLAGLIGVVLLAALAALPVRAGETQPNTYVVLIGISTYADPQIQPRPRAEDDAKALYQLFTDKQYRGVAPENVRLLLGNPDDKLPCQKATHDNIVQALRWVASKARRDDHVVLAWFGQGGPLKERTCYFAADSTLKDRAKNAVAAADIEHELDKLKSQHFQVFLDVFFKGGGKETAEINLSHLGNFREFLGNQEDLETHAPLGRVAFLPNSGLVAPLDLEKHGAFAQVVLNGLRGAADKEGYEPDGLITIDELSAYLDAELPKLARQKGQTDEQRNQVSLVLGARTSNDVLTYNPAVQPKVRDRLAKLSALAQEGKLSRERAEEGQALLSRMPKLKAQQELRRKYQEVVDGKLSVEDFEAQRRTVLAGMKIRKSAAADFAGKVIQASQILRDNYVRDVNQGELIAHAIRGLYRRIDEKLPTELKERLDKAKELTEEELTQLVADARERLGAREDLDNHKDLDYSLQRMMSHLDPYTTYIDPETRQRFQTETSGRFTGIGIQIVKNNARDLLQVVTPIKDSPAYKAGVKAGDLITTIIREVDNEGNKLDPPEVISTKGMSTADAVKKIQGKTGTKVKIVVEREGAAEPLEFELTRRLVEVETVLGFKRREADDGWDYIVDPQHKIAYVRITNFASKTAEQLHNVLRRLERQGINGFILDLRFNPGGLLTSAVEISDLFVDDGTIVSIKPRAGTAKPATYRGTSRDSYLNFPMVCLINGQSASGSEIVAAALQDNDRAIIMGERSYGKGSVQNIQPFEGGEIKLTTASFHRPNGKNLNKASTTGKEDEDWGVRPHDGFTLKLDRKERDDLYEAQREREIIPRRDLPPKETKPEFKDRQLEMAIEYLRSQIKTTGKVAGNKAG